MDILYTHVAGIDVHKKQVTVTARTPDPRRPVRREKTRTFRTFYADLLAMASWLAEYGVTRVAMESTGPYVRHEGHELKWEAPLEVRLMSKV